MQQAALQETFVRSEFYWARQHLEADMSRVTVVRGKYAVFTASHQQSSIQGVLYEPREPPMTPTRAFGHGPWSGGVCPPSARRLKTADTRVGPCYFGRDGCSCRHGAGVAHDAGTDLDQLELQAGQRPIRHGFGQADIREEDSEDVGQCVELEPNLAVPQPAEGEPGSADHEDSRATARTRALPDPGIVPPSVSGRRRA